MKAWKKLAVVIVTGVAVIGGVCLTMVEKTDAAIQRTVVGVVDGNKITLGDVNNNLKGLYTSLEGQYGSDYLTNSQIQSYVLYQRQSMLNSLVQENLMMLQAEKLGIVPSEDELKTQIDTKINELKEYLGDNYQEYIETYSENSVRDMFKNSIVCEVLENHMTKDLTVSDEEVETDYNENKNNYLNYGSANVKELVFKTEEEANIASEAIKNNTTTFDTLYSQYMANIEKSKAEDATDEDKKLPIANDLGTISYDSTEYTAAFIEALKSITTNGGVSSPISYNSEYVILQASDIIQTTEKPLNDELKEKIKTTLLANKKKDIMTNGLEVWKEEFNTKTYEDKLKEGLKNT